ncbi:PqqD family peptide modification chaperone [Rathayibacter sp. VKM Ac-2760]|uniref:PqqD family peptide modification chaperone n=1 Tax=Rathayibacter sp. VKM Ac-2760 TaxID=2609253 RepID=UPI001315B278|nr:PqqD family peptide modification chaperone [Rathayibacter sp. VKM Ac-2760]QHC60071.1 hypothetical protein GSU72_17060 [Rathayibacter sp. VKM Ac-2760]
MPRLDPRARHWRRHPDAAFVDLHGRVLVLPLAASPLGSPYAMRASVAETWRALGDEAQSFAELADRLAELHTVAAEEIADDLAGILTEMEQLLLVEGLEGPEHHR